MFICLMLYIYHNPHMYMRHSSIYAINAYPYVYTRSFFTHINAYMFEIMIMLPLKYIHHILIYLWFSIHQVNVFVLMSYIRIILQSSHSENALCIPSFLEVFQSSHSVSWNYRLMAVKLIGLVGSPRPLTAPRQVACYPTRLGDQLYACDVDWSRTQRGAEGTDKWHWIRKGCKHSKVII